jgi:hypothetical protein
VKRSRGALRAGIVAILLSACGSIDPVGLGGARGSGTDGSASADGGAVAPDAGAGPSGTGPDAAQPPAATGLVLRRAGFSDGLEDGDWQCNATLCLRGRITP